VQPVFEAVCCENPFPARYFTETAFNEMVLKAMFTGVALNRIIGLQARMNAALRRMARDYRSQQTAAGRTIPADISQLIEDGCR
jgi:hypothetical protein